MQTELRSIDSVQPYEHNPRVNDPAVELVADSIKEFGFRQPIVVDESGCIIVGHTRWKAAKHIGMTEVPVHVATGLTPAQAKAYRIADNKTNERAVWDWEKLTVELDQLKDMDVDLATLGFDEEELAKLNPSFAPDEDAEQGKLDQVATKTCPKCGYEWQ